MGVTLAKPPVRAFEGMVFPADTPVSVDARYVRAVHAHEVPVALREHADNVLGAQSGEAWWELGEFRYEGGDFTMAYGWWTPTGVQYGIDKD